MRLSNYNSVTFFMIIALLFNYQFLLAQSDEVKIIPTQLDSNVYMLTGQGGNIGVCVGEDGVFMVDDQFAPLTDKILATIKTLSDKPVKFVFNTHWHGDHTGGNENMGNKGAIIVAHKNVHQRMSTEQFMKAFRRKVPAAPKAALPVVTFTKDISFHFNGEDILAFHVHHAHTDGDAFVYFTKANVLHMGDVYFNGRYPFIDLGSGGNIDGIIKAVNTALMLVDSETKIIPGHGDASNKTELMAYRDMLTIIRDRVNKEVKAGKTLEEIKALNLSKDYDEKYGQNFIKPNRFIGFIYDNLKEKDKK